MEREIARKIIEKYNGEWVSKRDGFVMVRIVREKEEIIIWVRQTPITEKALELA